MTDKVKSNLEFEQALEQLKGVVKKMESDDLSLSAALTCYEQGIKLTNFCNDILKSTEQKVSKLMSEKNKEWLSVFKHDTDESK